MTLTTRDIDLVQQSWSRVLPIAEQAADLFYRRLFAASPELKPLFRSDMKDQGRKLMAMLNLAVTSLGRLELLLVSIRESGRRHAS